MDKTKKTITIIGAGISGLTTAYLLKKRGWQVNMLEAGNGPGGTIESKRINENLIDFGPNSALETTPLIGQLVQELNLEDQLVYANEKASKRYILKNDQLLPLPTSPGAFINSKLFSIRAKLNILLEPFKKKSNDGYNQSISRFVIRRLGKEFLDYAVNPFVSGIFAGNPDRLSVKSALPRLYKLEEQYGSLIKGMIKGAKERKKNPEKSKQAAKMFSFIEGMQTLPLALADKLEADIRYNCEVEKVERNGDHYQVTYRHKNKKQSLETDMLVSTVPAYMAKEVFKDLDANLHANFNRIYYPPVAVLYLTYPREAVKRPLDGFGFLIPAKENKKFLGAIWSSTLFPARTSESQAAFTLYIGGARNAQIFTMKEEVLVNQVLIEFQSIMKITRSPTRWYLKKWPRAIPQYNLGHHDHELYFEKFEKLHPGIFLSGNYRGGISVGDCIKNAQSTADRIKEYAG